MACCHKQYAEECVILVFDPAPYNPRLYQRLRFALLASSWLPRPLGIFLWSALHVMLLVVVGPVLWVLGLLTAFLYFSVFMFSLQVITYCLGFVFGGSIVVALDLLALPFHLLRFCWSSVRFLACHEPIVEWRVGACRTVGCWEHFKHAMSEYFWDSVPFGVPCMSNSLYKETKDRRLETWARWCEEVVHLHDAIAL